MGREWVRATAVVLAGAVWLTGYRWIESHHDWTPRAARSPLASYAREKGVAVAPMGGSDCEIARRDLASIQRERRERAETVALKLEQAIGFADDGNAPEATRLCREILRLDREAPLAGQMLRDIRRDGHLDVQFRATHVQAWLAARTASVRLADPLGN